MNSAVSVQCSTAVAPILAGGHYDDFDALLAGLKMLDWPNIELRLWGKWLGPGLVPRISGSILDCVARVGTVHAPPVEQLIGLRSERHNALALLDSSCQVMSSLGASSLIVHAWDLRVPDFRPEVMIDTLLELHDGHPLMPICIELIPGYTKMLPLLLARCSFAGLVVDTQWASLEDNWTVLFDNAPLVTNVHVQSFLDADDQGEIRLGRGRFGADCDVPQILKRMQSEGFSGLITLEPVGVPQGGVTSIRRGLEYLAGSRWRA